jgi:hypothetical protein
MNAFQGASLIEARGMAVLLPYIEEKAYQGRFVRTCKGPLARFLQEELGDVLVNTSEDTLYSAEIKVEQRHTGRLFLETWSNRNLDHQASHAERGSNPGWMLKLRADVLLYYFLDTDDLYTIPMFRLKRWAFGTGDQRGRIYDFPEKPQSRYRQMNDTWGRVVDVAILMREAGIRHTKVRQLTMWSEDIPA